MMLKRQEVYGGDLETDNDPYNNLQGFIFQYALSDGYNSLTGTSAEGFLKDAKRVLDNSGFKEIFIYFHNLSFDIEFLLPAIYELELSGVRLKIFRRRGAVSTFRLEYPSGKSVVFRNSANKFPGKLKDVGVVIGHHKLGGFDFFPGWSQYVDLDDDANWEYVKRDAEIVARAMIETHTLGFIKGTTSGDALHIAKQMNHEKCIETFGWSNSKDPRDAWRQMFPTLTRALDKHLRKAYLGGVNLTGNRGKIVYTDDIPVQHYDVVSMYPTVMKYDELPYKTPNISLNPPKNGELYVRSFRAKIHIKDGKTPWFRFSEYADYFPEGLKHSEPVKSCKEWHNFVLCNIDIESLEEFYDVEYDTDYISIYHIFRSIVGWFGEYVDRFMNMKNNSVKDTLPYIRAKLMMNGLYGRFGLSNVNEITTLVMDSDGSISWDMVEEIREDNDAYIPYALFVTAHARRRLLNGVKGISPENIVHADTDSLIFKGDFPATITAGDSLGEWKFDGKPIKYMYEGGFKRYIKIYADEIQTLDDVKFACAGVPSGTDDDGCPIGMWIELLDDPSLITKDAVLGRADYKVKSKWLRDLLLKHGKNPDCVNTFKNVKTSVKNGIYLAPTTFTLSDDSNAFMLTRK